MIVQTFLGNLPGRRLEDYRNSVPRYVKVLGIGPGARDIVESFNEQHRDNILVTNELDPHRLLPMDEPVNGLKPNAVIVVYQTGEEVKFPYLTDRTASMLSFIVVETPGVPAHTETNRKLRDIQAVADLYVTTSDREFVGELVGNLAS
jgi:hypothetical protein